MRQKLCEMGGCLVYIQKGSAEQVREPLSQRDGQATAIAGQATLKELGQSNYQKLPGPVAANGVRLFL